MKKPTSSNASTTTTSSTYTAPHPSKVGNSFVKQYYHLLAKSPETLHRFYKDESTFTHGIGSQEIVPISGQKNINEKIMSMGYKGARVDLECGSVDCQTSLDGGVLVMVAGTITLKGQAPQAFVQTFFLAVQPNGYFVLNDSIRFLEVMKPTITPPISPPLPPIPATNPPLPPTPPEEPPKSAEVPSPIPTPSSPIKSPVKGWGAQPNNESKGWNDVVNSPVSKPMETETVKSPVQKQVSPVMSPTETPASPPSEPLPPSVPSQPKSWASHLFSGKPGETAPETKKVPSSTTAPKPSWGDEAASSPRATPVVEKEKPNRKVFIASSLFLREIPQNTKESELRELFKPYGTITGVNVLASKGYAFVDYDNMDAVRNALAHGPFKLNDVPIHVEERGERRVERGGYRSDGRGGRGGRGQRVSRMDRRDHTNRQDRDRRDNKSGGRRGGRGDVPSGGRGNGNGSRAE